MAQASDRAAQPGAKIGAIAVIIAAMGVVFLIVNTIHFRFFPVSVILYACLLDLALTILIVAPAIWIALPLRAILSREEQILSLLLASAGITLYAVMGPTVIDRSLSIYIVEKIEQRGGAVHKDRFDEIFIQEYIPEYRLIDVRLTEQFTSGTVRRSGECVVLTPRGRILAKTMGWYRRTFLPRKRVLLDEVTDQLTRPFENAPQVVDVSCDPAAPTGLLNATSR